MSQYFIYASYPSMDEADEAVEILVGYGIDRQAIQLASTPAVNESLKATQAGLHVIEREVVGADLEEAYDQDAIFVLVDEAAHDQVVQAEGTANHPKGIELPATN